MFTISKLKQPLITSMTVLMFTIGAGVSFAQDGAETVITAIDPATGRVVEAPKMFSEMTEEEKAAYTEEDLKILEAHEAQLKKQMPKY